MAKGRRREKGIEGDVESVILRAGYKVSENGPDNSLVKMRLTGG
jgi:hypothetical protein